MEINKNTTEYETPVFVRCHFCSGSTAVILLLDSYPAKLLANVPAVDPRTNKVSFQIVPENIYMCEEHYRRTILREKSVQEIEAAEKLAKVVKEMVQKGALPTAT